MQRFRPMEPLKSLDRALALLDALLDEHAPPAPAASFSVSELARRLHVDKSTVSRIAATLEGRGYLQRDPVSRRYQLGPKIQPPTPWHDHAHHLRTLAHPVLERLVDKTGECAHIALLVGDRALIIEDLEAKSRGLQVRAGVGRTMPLHCTALGKAFLAFTPTPIPDVLHPRTERTITRRAALNQHLDEIRLQGYAFDDVENEEGVRCLAAPVRDASGATIAALGISAPLVRLDDDSVEPLATSVKRAAAACSRLLGHEPAQVGEAARSALR